jgi:hypothetical protein
VTDWHGKSGPRLKFVFGSWIITYFAKAQPSELDRGGAVSRSRGRPNFSWLTPAEGGPWWNQWNQARRNGSDDRRSGRICATCWSRLSATHSARLGARSLASSVRLPSMAALSSNRAGTARGIAGSAGRADLSRDLATAPWPSHIPNRMNAPAAAPVGLRRVSIAPCLQPRPDRIRPRAQGESRLIRAQPLNVRGQDHRCCRWPGACPPNRVRRI